MFLSVNLNTELHQEAYKCAATVVQSVNNHLDNILMNSNIMNSLKY